MNWLIAAIGGGIGAVARYFVIQLTKYWNLSSAYATMFVNLAGSFFIGILANNIIEQQALHLFFTLGILGGFTTYSTFSLDIVKLLQKSQYIKLITYIAINLIGGLIFFILGFTIL